ncbi:DUF1563 domain-containing protein [Campylobacter helveticus]|nr:DUF1563 domain-containing protein [Campylobacter helveticus]
MKKYVELTLINKFLDKIQHLFKSKKGPR